MRRELVQIQASKMSGKYDSQNGDTKVKNGGVNIYTYKYMQHDVLDMETLRGAPSS